MVGRKEFKMEKSKITIKTFWERKERKEKITMLTCYDYATALIMNNTDIDAILVGDSLGMVILGYKNTLPVTIDEMLHHTKAVVRGISKQLIIVDMPIGSYHISEEEAVKNAMRLIKEGGAEGVKIEGGRKRASLIKRLIDAEVPVMGHIGLTPQSVNIFGGYKIQGRNKEEEERLVEDALSIQEAGAFSIVLECIPVEVAKEITENLKIPTIGIGSGWYCDGQILVLQDMLGYWEKNPYKFVKTYSNLYNEISKAIQKYCNEVREGKFPAIENSFSSF